MTVLPPYGTLVPLIRWSIENRNDPNDHSNSQRSQRGQLVDNLPFYEIINYVYDLKITPNDGFPERICENCFSAVMTFKVYKANAHKAKLELLRRKQKVNNVSVKEERVDQRNRSDEDTSSNDRGSRDGAQDSGSFLSNEVENFNSAEILSIVKVESTDEVENGMQEPLVEVETYEPSKDASRTHQCQYCKKIFHRKSHLTGHLVTHTGEKAFECHICKKRFSIKGNLLMHLRIHSGNKPFSCDVCSKRFSQKSTLQSHLITHTSARPFSCHVCEKTFTFNSSLRKHLKRHKKDAD
ncbi:hypothetical protein J437_LFUL013298 [Ladona fulva]|uniref:C2H2-type domain-containing protein n=1 Tax=Ladona fulva TaxID=123851 RepID=A0A8K0P4S8_LADFU|nr:hypothetical protein J437_LFUL013298 [Ladona fulva]